MDATPYPICRRLTVISTIYGLCLGMDVVTDPQMSSKSATNHNFEPSGA